ncbi:MAG: ATP-dependent RecD-like DNA helicase [Bacilli bacterium]|nr:ATP-dependent RecD-like DNA helicase [Bacilli bacterium]
MYIKGTLKKFIFKSNNGYVVALFRVKESSNELDDLVNRTITITGYFHELSIDENYIMNGELVDNPKYGKQFNVTSYDRYMPSSKEGIIEFLSGGLFKGVGEKTAKGIVDTLGDDTLKLIEEDYSNLLLVPGLKESKAKNIHETLLKYNESYNVIVYLNEIGFNSSDSLKIYNEFKDKTMDIINENVYLIIDFISDINFLKIEKIRKNLGIKDDDKNRIIYLIEYVIKNYLFNTGDTYFYKEDIYKEVTSYLSFDFSLDDLEIYLDELVSLSKIIIKDNKYYLFEYYFAEDNISNFITYLCNKTNNIKKIDKEIENVEEHFNIKYNDMQKKAIKESLITNFNIISGGPGTGKTTIIKGILELYKRVNHYTYLDMLSKVILLAPTGRAAKRMSESATFKSSTIHRFLKWDKDNDRFMINEENKSNVELVIIDEVSMIDTLLLNNLFLGLNRNVNIVMIGDYNQLESVSPGKVLKDLIDSDMVSVTFLNELYRQEENSYIATLAKEIRDNDLSDDFLLKRDDYNFIECTKDNLLEYTKKLVLKAIEKGYNSSDIQVLAPMYKGINGIDNLNIMLEKIFNPDDKPSIRHYDTIYKVDDKVLKLENDPDNNVFNGDIGYISDIVDDEVHINFDGTVVIYKYKDLSTIKHAYAISIHKSQGSEFNLVIMPIISSYKIMLYKKLIYTGITRAKHSLTLIGEKNAFMYAVNNNNSYERRTGLKDKIISSQNNA